MTAPLVRLRRAAGALVRHTQDLVELVRRLAAPGGRGRRGAQPPPRRPTRIVRARTIRPHVTAPVKIIGARAAPTGRRRYTPRIRLLRPHPAAAPVRVPVVRGAPPLWRRVFRRLVPREVPRGHVRLRAVRATPTVTPTPRRYPRRVRPRVAATAPVHVPAVHARPAVRSLPQPQVPHVRPRPVLSPLERAALSRREQPIHPQPIMELAVRERPHPHARIRATRALPPAPQHALIRPHVIRIKATAAPARVQVPAPPYYPRFAPIR